MYRKKHRILSLLLCLLLLLPLFPAVVTAEEQAASEDGVTVVYEVESKRTAFEKHYLLSNGNYYAVSYAEAIHEQDQNGKWVDVDNTPVYSAKALAHTVKGKTYSAAFDSKKGKTSLAGKDGNALSWHYELLGSTNTKEKMTLSASKAVLQSTSALSPKGRAVSDQETFALPKAQGALRFEKAFGSMNADLSYTVSPQKIKEDVILYTKGEVTALSMVVENCAYTAELSGAMVLFKDTSGKTAFKVDAPYMFDAAGADSTDIAVAVEQKGTTVTITYTPSASWLNAAERVYPVTFDPAVTTNDYQANIEDMYIMSNDSKNATASRLYVGKISSNDSRAYFRINNLPQTENLPITAVTFDLSFYSAASSTVSGKTLKLEQVAYNGSFSGLTYTTLGSPVYAIDSKPVNTGDTRISFDMLTAGFLEAAAENTPFTCRLRFSETLSSGNLQINSMESSSVSKPKPLLTVYYGYENPSFNASQIYFNTPASSAERKILKMTGNTLSMVSYTSGEARAAMKLETGTNGVYINVPFEGNYLNAASVTAGSAVSGSTTGDEWLIRQVNTREYLVSLAASPALVLTRTSSGIVLQKVSSALAEDQYWRISDTNGAFLFSGRTIEDGIYYINNLQTRTFLIKNGTATTTPTLQAGTESALGDKMAWKITFIGNGLYMIESVLSPNHYLHASAAGVSVERIAAGEVPAKAKFRITANGANKFFIKSGTNHYLASSASSATALTVATSPASVGNKAGWRLCLKEEYEEFSASSLSSVTYVNPLQTVPTVLNNSTTWCKTEDLTITANSNTSAVTAGTGGQVTGTAQGGISTITIKHIPSGKSRSITVKCGWLKDGMYFFQNMDSNLFLQPDDGDDNHMEQHKFTPAEQQWTFTLLLNGNYKILSSDNLALSVQLGEETNANKALVQRTFNSTDLCQQWHIDATASGGYKVQAASAIANDVDLVMAVGTGITPGTNVEQRELSENSRAKGEWHIFNNKQLNTPLIEQNDDWCWATAAQMLARTHFPTTTNPNILLEERKQAVYHVFGDDSATAETYDWVNDPQNLLETGGWPCHAAQAAAYYAGMAGENITYTSAYAPYSEETLIRFLNDGLPVEHMCVWLTKNVSINANIDAIFDFDSGVTLTDAINISSLMSKTDIEGAGGHAIIIAGMRWEASENCMKYTVIDPEKINSAPIELTYEELIFLKKDTDGDSKIDEVSIWTSSVVKKTDYSDNLLFSDHFIADYNSLEEFGGAQ